MKKFFLFMMSAMAPGLVASPLPEKADLLATNTVIARFDGYTDIPCQFMTADCPDKCGHATKVANFTVLVNENYARPGKYGDDKAEVGSVVMVDMKKPTPGQDDAAVYELVDALKAGDTVRLTQEHLYVDDGCAQFPVRPVTRMEKVDAPAAAAAVPAPVPAAPIMPRMMPGRRAL